MTTPHLSARPTPRAAPIRLLAGLLALAALDAGAGNVRQSGPPHAVVDGPTNDYQTSVIVPWQQPDRRIAVFERLDAGYSGDLWLTHSADGGATWSTAQPVITGSANQRHPSLVQTGPEHFLLAWLDDAFGYRIHLARAGADLDFRALGPAQLGWPSAGEINPQLLRLPDGRLLIAYQRLGGAAHVAISDDDGASWDQARSQISPGVAALPRLAYRRSDGHLLAMYQTGNNPVTIWSRSSADPLSWTGPVHALATGFNDHDPWPVAMADGRFAVLWARSVGGAFQIHSAHSADGLHWSAPVPHTPRPGLNNVQPHVPGSQGRAGRVELYWGAAQTSGLTDLDIWRQPAVIVIETIFADGFQALPGQ